MTKSEFANAFRDLTNRHTQEREDLLAQYLADDESDEDDETDPLAFLPVTEREIFKVTRSHADWTSEEVAVEVRRRLGPTAKTTGSSVRSIWLAARKDPRRKALLPKQRQTDA